MGAVSTIATTTRSPEEVIAEHAGAMQAICTRLIARVEHVERENVKVNVQLVDALDRVHELETKLREKDQIIEELQQLRAGRR